jgi:NAD(P)-dependent dehydrogenase (short-subunit alcohol dehydrogenase family)
MKKAIVIGASGGIGSALSDALEQRGYWVARLHRQSQPPVDFDDEASLASAAATLADPSPFDLIVVASGILSAGQGTPEKTFRAITADTFGTYFRVNATGPALAARHFLDLLRRDERAVFAFLSARVGSIGDNRLGGWIGYRASKAALNQIVRTIAIELSRTRKNSIVVALHPGTVDTGLSKPFQRNLPDGQLLSPADSAEALLDVINALGPQHSGNHFDWRGEQVPD